MRNLAALLGAFLLCLGLAGASAAEQGEQVFARETSLMAFVRVRNFASVDARISKFLQGIYSGAPVAQPLKDAFGKRLHNPALTAVLPTTWAEATLFSLPQEADNDWVYAVRSGGEEAYVTALLDGGNIRRESREEGITRFRATEGENFLTFFAAFPGPDILVIGRNHAAVEKARKMYAFSAEDGLFAGYGSDLAAAVHFNRYLLTVPRVLSDASEALRGDLVRDLAGVQAKQDNPLSLGLAKTLAGLTDLAREVAVAEFTAEFREDALAVNVRLSARYGGGIHYALSNLKPAMGGGDLSRCLPAGAVCATRGRLWPEMYSQVLDGAGHFFQAALARETPGEMLAETRKFLGLLQEAGPLEYAGGLIDSPANRKGAGPVYISVTRWKDAQKLAALWESGTKIVGEGQLSEALAERGMKLQIETEAISAGGWPVRRAEFSMRSTYFALPGGLGKPQHYLAAVQGEYLVLALAAGPVSADEYAAAEPWLLDVLTQTLVRLPNTAGAAPAVSDAPAVLTGGLALSEPRPGEWFCVTGNPLRLLQTAVHAESVWPDAAEPNRLPVPWGQYYAEFTRFPATATPAVLRCSGRAEGMEWDLLLPRAALSELAGATLDFSAPLIRE